jgi:hypothetical protein
MMWGRYQSRNLYPRGMYTWAVEESKYKQPLCFHPEKLNALLDQNEKTRTGACPMMRRLQLRKRRVWKGSDAPRIPQSGGIYRLA